MFSLFLKKKKKKKKKKDDKCPEETLCMSEVNLNPCILRMFEDTFSLGAALIVLLHYYIMSTVHVRRRKKYII